jgi:hypothetical protein
MKYTHCIYPRELRLLQNKQANLYWILINSRLQIFFYLDQIDDKCLGSYNDAPVAQLDRARPSGGRGQGFESSRARQ